MKLTKLYIKNKYNNSRENVKRILCLFLAIMILTIMSSVLNLKVVYGTVGEAASNNEKSIENNEDIIEFIDNYFNENMDKYNVPGVSVSIIKDNKEVLCKGYGYSDLSKEKKVDPYETTFPLASGSKLFTATAIMQLYEQGKIELDSNIEEYITPYKIVNNFDKSVTIRQLLTHSSGLDESSELNSKTINKDDIKSQEYYMDTHTPVVIKEPGSVCRYSNEGYNLLGYIVERVSGMSYEDYIKENILEPLEMNASSVRLYDDKVLSKGYMYDDETYNEFQLLYQYASGSSGIITTAADMENFMAAYLNKGSYNGASILNEKTCEYMMKKQFANAEDFAGMGFGFVRSNRNGQRIIKHEGALPGYTTTTFMLPDKKLGISILTNSLSALPFNFEDEFLNYFYPCNNNKYLNAVNDNSSSSIDLSKYEGTYRSYDGVSVTNLMKIGGITEDMVIKDNKDGTLTLNEWTTEKEKIKTRLVPVDNNKFLREDGKGFFEFRTDNKGNVSYAFNDISFNSFEKIHFYEKAQVIFSIMGAMLIFLIFNGILFIIYLVKKKKYKLKVTRMKKILMHVNLLTQFIFTFSMIGSICLINFLSLNNDLFSVNWIYILLSLIKIGVGLSIIVIASTLYFTIRCKENYKEKIYYILNSVINFAFVFMLYYFNLLSYRLS